MTKEEDKLTDEQIAQVSGGAEIVVEKPKTEIVVGAVGDMKKDPA